MKKQIEKLQELAEKFNYHLNSAMKLKDQIEAVKGGKEFEPTPDITKLADISRYTSHGKMLLAAIIKISTESQTDKTPDEIIRQLNTLISNLKEPDSPTGAAIQKHCKTCSRSRYSESVEICDWCVMYDHYIPL
jgi:hypothetical protein